MKPADLLLNSHFNTILPIYLTGDIQPNYARKRIETPDRDFIDCDWVNFDRIDQPLVILFHGTEGSSKSHYAKRIMYYLEQIGWRGVVPHFRGCSEEINLRLRFYHAGETEDVASIIKNLSQLSSAPIFAIGVSIGGNILLKYLGESKANSGLNAAIAVSTPFDLKLSAEAMANGVNKHIYAKYFLKSLLPKMQQYASRFDNFIYINKKIDTLDEFNNLYLCQVTNFTDTLDYYQKSSCKQFLKYIETPTMILQARNDPLVPVASWPTKDELSKQIRFISTRSGGHAGFITTNSNRKGALLKLPRFLVDYFKKTTRIENETLTTTPNNITESKEYA